MGSKKPCCVSCLSCLVLRTNRIYSREHNCNKIATKPVSLCLFEKKSEKEREPKKERKIFTYCLILKAVYEFSIFFNSFIFFLSFCHLHSLSFSPLSFYLFLFFTLKNYSSILSKKKKKKKKS